MRSERLAGWGRNSWTHATVHESRDTSGIRDLLQISAPLTNRGLGRSYGDSSLGPTVLLHSNRDRLISFDPDTGILECEAGLSLSEVLRLFVPRGWFPPVTPGTRFVTIGGMLASDVHGKNHHHSGSFARHVLGFRLLTADGEIRWVDRKTDQALFLATAGGMGLTGAILSVRFQMIPITSAWIRQETRKVATLDELLDQFEDSAGATYSVAWVDCLATGKHLGRSLLMLGEHALPGELPNAQTCDPFGLELNAKVAVPCNFPEWSLNRWSVAAFNTLYFQRVRQSRNTTTVPLVPFFYPLDAMLHWNRIYGRRGFYQYQCVLPKKPDGSKALRTLLRMISKAGAGSFLTVLKLFGPEDEPYLSFATEGYTLALDFPASPASLALLNRLDEVVQAARGRLYLTKDARMNGEMLRSGYPRLAEFLQVKRRIDPNNHFTSQQAERLGLIA